MNGRNTGSDRISGVVLGRHVIVFSFFRLFCREVIFFVRRIKGKQMDMKQNQQSRTRKLIRDCLPVPFNIE